MTAILGWSDGIAEYDEGFELLIDSDVDGRILGAVLCNFRHNTHLPHRSAFALACSFAVPSSRTRARKRLESMHIDIVYTVDNNLAQSSDSVHCGIRRSSDLIHTASGPLIRLGSYVCVTNRSLAAYNKLMRCLLICSFG